MNPKAQHQMKKYAILILCSIVFSVGLSSQDHHSNQKINDKTQREIIKELSGATNIEGKFSIENRSSFENRALARTYLANLIKDIGLEPQVQEYVFPNVNPMIDLLFNPFKGANVYTVLPSTNQSDEYIILGAHFDTELNCPGAIDNGTGVALIYRVLVDLSKLPQRKKNVIIVFFDQEEEDLIGSQAFAKYVKANKFNIHSVHTFDTMGWDKDNDRAIELELPTPGLEKIYRKHAEKLAIPVYISPCNSTDHHSFRAMGYHAIGLTDEYYNGDYPPHKDTPNDKFDTVNFDYLQSCTQLVFATIEDLIQ